MRLISFLPVVALLCFASAQDISQCFTEEYITLDDNYVFGADLEEHVIPGVTGEDFTGFTWADIKEQCTP